MSSSFKFTALAVVLLASVAAAQPALSAAPSDGVVATVNGDKIMKADVLKALKELGVKESEQEQVFPMAVNQIINEKLIDAETAKANITASEDYKKRLQIIETQLAKQIYLENQLKEKISEKAVKGEYEKFKKENKGKQEMNARHILVPTEEEAKQVIKDLEGGAKFEELASKRSSGPTAQNGGDLGWFTKEEMIKEFSDAAFALKPGTYTKTPVKTQFGWHVIKAVDKRDRKIPELAEVEGAIRNKLGQDAMKGLIDDLRQKADIQVFSASEEKTQKN